MEGFCPFIGDVFKQPPAQFGGATQIRTGESRICSPLPYHLAMAPLVRYYIPESKRVDEKMERATRFELATSTLARWRSAK